MWKKLLENLAMSIIIQILKSGKACEFGTKLGLKIKVYSDKYENIEDLAQDFMRCLIDALD